jgi:hypothetical protein
MIMSRMGDLYIELEEYVCEALENGARCETDVIDYLNTHHPNFPVIYDKDVIADLMDVSFEDEHDGQPDEAQEWHDFDPDC